MFTAVTLGTAAGAASSPLANTSVDAVAPASTALVADFSGQFPDNQLTATTLVAADASIVTPGGVLTGPDGVTAFIDSLRTEHPDAQFAVTEFQAFNRLLIVEWQGAVAGEVVVSGRTLATIEGNDTTEVFFVDPNALAPIDGTVISQIVAADAASNTD